MQETFRNPQNLQLQRAGFVVVQAPYLGLFIALNIADLLLWFIITHKEIQLLFKMLCWERSVVIN